MQEAANAAATTGPTRTEHRTLRELMWSLVRAEVPDGFSDSQIGTITDDSMALGADGFSADLVWRAVIASGVETPPPRATRPEIWDALVAHYEEPPDPQEEGWDRSAIALRIQAAAEAAR
jgi:hypothetical protein